MTILVLGGTRFFGVPMIEKLLSEGHEVTIATRGLTPDAFGDRIQRIRCDLFDYHQAEETLGGLSFDAVIDKVTYSSNELRVVMDAVSCETLIHMSTCSLYTHDHFEISEKEFDPYSGEIIWNDRMEADYSTNKKRSEQVLFQYQGKAEQKRRIAVRYPFVVGPHDYTNRLRFYAEHLVSGKAMWIDDLEAKIGFIEEKEAGEFFSTLLQSDFEGPINGAADGTVSMQEVLAYLTKKTGKESVISKTGDPAPYNGMQSHSYSLEKSKKLGYHFSDIHEWLEPLLDFHLKEMECL